MWGALVFPEGRRLVFSCGFRSGYDTLTRVLGTEGEIRMTGPFHPGPEDEVVIVREGTTDRQPATTSGEMSFTPAIRHIHRVVRGLEEPRHLAVDEAMGNAKAIAALLGSARSQA
jgi:predicted dehydrogenase